MRDEHWNGWQTLAWIAWRKRKAVRLFSGPDAEQLWEAAKQNRWPKGLGLPMVLPVEAERLLLPLSDRIEARRKPFEDMETLDASDPGTVMRRIREEPEKLIVPLHQVQQCFKLTDEELLAELRSGRLVASGRPTMRGYADMGVTVDKLIEWMITDEGKAATARRDAH
ncbi:MAG TPA: hypothetical protein VL614_03405 [Acetobacteraceae bacterium]|jgi:hypothetical protein|nr:hypothetical protein [Acetobacteraceae bacterium]